MKFFSTSTVVRITVYKKAYAYKEKIREENFNLYENESSATKYYHLPNEYQNRKFLKLVLIVLKVLQFILSIEILIHYYCIFVYPQNQKEYFVTNKTSLLNIPNKYKMKVTEIVSKLHFILF